MSGPVIPAFSASEAGCGLDGLGDRHHLRGRVYAAAACATVDLHEAIKRRAVLLGRCRELGDIRQIVDAHDDAYAVARQPRQPIDLGWIAHPVRHEYILDTGAREDFGLRHLLAADPNRPAELLLQAQYVDRFVHLPMGAVAHVVGPDIVAHLADVALERIEIEDQARRLDLFLGHAGNSRDIIADLATGEFGFDVHVVVLPYWQGNLSMIGVSVLMITPAGLRRRSY